MGNKFEYLIGVGLDCPRKIAQIADHLGNLHMTEYQLSDHKWMHDDNSAIEKSRQP